MQYGEYDVLPPSAVAENVGGEAIGLARRILRRHPGTAAALDPELAERPGCFRPTIPLAIPTPG
jgi:hypothetical protein